MLKLRQVPLRYKVWTMIIVLVIVAELGYFFGTGTWNRRDLKSWLTITLVMYAVVVMLMTQEQPWPSPIKYFGMPHERWTYTGGHMTAEDLQRYSHGVMTDDEKVLVWEHAVVCQSCHEDLVAVDEFA